MAHFPEELKTADIMPAYEKKKKKKEQERKQTWMTKLTIDQLAFFQSFQN